jgi:hypothetical protein
MRLTSSRTPSTRAADVEQKIANQLAGAVIGHLPATVHLYHRDIARKQQVFGLSGLALGKHRRMLQQPDFVVAVRIACIGELLHGLPGRPVFDQAELTHTHFVGHHSTM